MYLLDTNVVSEPRRGRPDPGVMDWLSRRSASELYVSVLTLAEIRRGALRLDAGQRREELTRWLGQLISRFEDRVLAVDLEVSERWAILAEAQRAAGRASDMTDELIAATAVAHGLTVVTRNLRHFEEVGCPVLSPWSR